MQTFSSTIDTLYEVMISLCIRTVMAVIGAYNQPSQVKKVESTAHVDSEEEVTPKTFKSMQQLLKVDAYALPSAHEKHVVMYVGTKDVPIYKNPTVAFDEQIGTIPYGSMVMMREPQGRFFHIVWNTVEGWAFRDDFVDRAANVYPEFFIGQEYSVDHKTTVSVRLILGDVFGLNRSEFGLQAGEYVLYKLWKKGIHITWPPTRPRVPGVWHKILKGLPNVHIGVVPRVGTVMEYLFDGDVGHVAYVEAVFPDNTISISEANYPDSGVYNERVLTKEEWRECRPVFITIQ